MADWAGAYGAGGAAQALEQIVARQFLERKQAEVERAQRAQEAQAQAELAQRAEAQRQMLALQHANLAADRDEAYQGRVYRRDEFNTRMQRDQQQDELHMGERARDRAERAAEREDEQAFRTGERKARESFERSLAGRVNANEPLVSITDPATGQPKLVPRSQAVGQRPASTREQSLTEGQSNAAGFADRMKFNEDFIRRFDAQATSRGNQLRGMLLPNELQSDAQQGYETAKKNWIAAILRKESGAAISPSEYAEGNLQYFPQPGESAAVVEQKRQLRAVSEAAMRRSSGSAGVDGVTGAQATQTRQVRNKQTGETRQQVSNDGGVTWSWAN